MSENVITVKSLTKDYGNGHGIFNLNFEIEKGETFGFVGTNGSGKTTTIRHIMGFLKPDEGSVKVCGLDAWLEGSEIKKKIEYVPGEIAFPDLKDGRTFLKSQAELLGISDMSHAEELIKKLQLDTRASLKRMSKGMKQKTAIVSALMADKDILILDEPTTGLDPLMRDTFLEIIKEEKAKGKTILMSSQMFEELESTCDRVALIFNGKIVDIADIHKLKNQNNSILKVEFEKKGDFEEVKRMNFDIVRVQEQYNQLTIKISNDKLNQMFNLLKNYNLKYIACEEFNLEKYFKAILLKGGENV
ncbi:MAG: ATP-binding cassette domain-containing protein [Clostridia bacterium]|nr:ATP-binding cassette domain-containing protein [Clostridia bacterium]